LQGVVVAFGLREREEVGRIAQPGVDLVDGADDGLERRALLAQVLRLLGVVPDLRVF
jgi:hypothetical protein